MSIKKAFNGKVLRKPGAYSRDLVDNSSGSPTIETGVLMIVGESTKGKPGATSGIVSYPVERLSTLVADFGSGPLVDCAVAASNPSRQPGISGVSRILVYKTNASTQASAFLKQTASNIYSVKDRAWGLGGNDLSVIVAAGDTANQKTISVAKVGDTTESLGQNQAQSVLTIQYTGNGSAATMTIAGATQLGKTLVTALTGQSDGSVNLNILLKNYTMKTLCDFINAQTGYTCTLNTVSLASKAGYELDPVTAGDIKTAPVVRRRLQYEILDVLNTSARVEATIEAASVVGLIDNATTFLTGGAQGASTNSNFSTGMAASLAEDYNVLLAAVSRDASEDIADAVQGFTDPSSTYTIASVLAAVSAHVQLRSDTVNRKEAQGFGGVRKSTKSAAFAAVAALGQALMQVAIQDCMVLAADGSLTYMHPHVTAAVAAGMRCGQPVGEPLTHKYPNFQDAGHFINPETGLAAGDFNPGLDANDAIDNGVLFVEKANGGFRFVVDNTTYGIDESFIYNRGSVIQAAQFVDKTLRATAENAFVGKKISKGAADSIKNVIRNKLRELNQPDVNIITSSDDAPEGFREDTFTVTIVGNTASVHVEYKPVQGLDFVLFDFTIGNIVQSA